MFTEIEFETNQMIKKENEGGNLLATSVTSVQGSTEMYHLSHNLILPEL